jgi:hypothetical protein
MKKLAYTCDECGAERAGTNHWFCLIDLRKDVSGGFAIRTFANAKDLPEVEHLCGQACVQKRVDSYLVAM